MISQVTPLVELWPLDFALQKGHEVSEPTASPRHWFRYLSSMIAVECEVVEGPNRLELCDSCILLTD